MNTKPTIPESIAHLSQKWGLSSIRPLAESRLINNYVAIAHSALCNADVVLKILLWENPHEEKALRYFNGQGCVKLLEYDAEYQAFLLQYIQPGDTLRSFFPDRDKEAVEIVAALIKRLHTHDASNIEPGSFPTVREWLKELDQEYQKVPLDLLVKARTLATKLVSTEGTLYLLHGDLHHENILQYSQPFVLSSTSLRIEESWIAIDPKGVIGELEYELGAFIRNPIPDLILHPDVQQLTKRRIEQFSALLNFDAQRVTDWCFVQSVLSACWVEGYGKDVMVNYFVSCARIMERNII